MYAMRLNSRREYIINLLFYRVRAGIATLLYITMLHWIYVNQVSPNFSYMGYTFYEKDFINIFFAYLFGILPILFIPFRAERPSEMVTIFIYILVYIPSIIISTLALNIKFENLFSLYISLFISMVFLSIAKYAHFPFEKLVSINIKNIWLFLFYFLILTILIAYLITVFGLKPPPSILEVYETRLLARQVEPFTAYALRLVGNVLGPTLIAFGLLQKRIVWIIIGLFLQLLIYSFDGTKSTLFSPLLIFTVYYFLRKETISIDFVLLYIVLIIIFMQLLTLFISEQMLIATSIFIRRLIVTPGLLTGYYYEFFSEHPTFLWSHSILRYFMDPPFPVPPSFVIGFHYFGSDMANANANLWADAIANAGILAPPLISLLAGLYFRLVDWVSRGKEHFALLVLATPSFALVNSAFLTSLLTHGLLAALVVIWLCPRRLLRNE